MRTITRVAAPALAGMLFLGVNVASASLVITEVQTLDVDGTVTVWDGATVYEPKGINNYVTQFTYDDGAGGKVVDTSSYAAFQGSASNAQLAIQPTSVGSQAFATAGEYLSAGTRGLSTSTAINVTQLTSPITLTFQITDSIFVGPGDDILFLADAANRQSNDAILLKDSGGVTIGNVNLTEADWSGLGSHTIDRWNLVTDSIEDPATTRTLSFIGLTWGDFGITSSAQIADLASIEFLVPSPGETPRTDYAFFAANTDFIESPDVVPTVPTVSSLLLMLAALPLFASVAARRKS